MKSKLLIILYSAIVIVILSSCPSPLEPFKLDVYKDLNAPVITVNSPSQDSLYRSSATISGKIIDIDNDGNSRSTDPGSYIKASSYFILNHDTESTTLQVTGDGSFCFTIDTADYST